MLAAAGATVMIALGIVGIPHINACAEDDRGLIACLRDNADRKFDLPGEPRTAEIETPHAVEAPVAAASPAAEPAAPSAEILPTEAPATAAAPPEVTPAGQSTSDPPSAEALPGQGGPLLPARPADIAAAPATPPAEPTSTVQRQAALEKAAAPTNVALPRPSPQPVKPAATVDMMVVAPIKDKAPSGPATPAPATQRVPAPIAAPSAPAHSPNPVEDAAVPGTEIAALPGPATPKPAPPASATPSPTAEETAAEFLAPDEQVAANEVPSASEPPPSVAAPLILAPTIDAIELEGAASYISGSGPTGAIVRLYSDGKLLGESPVEDGRWLIEAGEILDAEVTELRAEAVEAETGKSLGESIITVEIELPEEQPAAPTPDAPVRAPMPVEAAPEPASPPANSQPSTQAPELPVDPSTPAPPATDPPAPGEELPATDDPEQSAPESPTSEGPPQPVPPPDPTEEEGQGQLPPLAVTVPDKTSPSVGILPIPDTEFTPLPLIGATEHEPATIELPRPDAPALMAEFALPTPDDDTTSVTVLRLFPFGDPVYARFSGGQAIIRRGDTLWSLARRYYGAGIHYDTIFKANRDQIRRPSRIYPGQVFDLPIVTEE